MPDVHSKAIRRVSHKKSNGDMIVHMHDGSNLLYFNVPRHVYHELLDAPSVGQYYNLFVRDNYPFEVL